MLASRLDALRVNLTELATKENLVLGRDEERNTIIVDEKRMTQKLKEIIKQSDKKDIVIDGHYAASVVPKRLITHVFVLRRDPVELRKFMENCGFTNRKLWENLASEILDVCLVDALNVHGNGKVCELNVTGKSVNKTVDQILNILKNREKCCIGVVDWLARLESEGLTEEFLRI
jgi:adenylate kinase